MPDWAFILVIWWAGWFAVLLVWYETNRKEPLTALVCFFMFLVSGFIFPIAVYHSIRKATKKDK